MQLLKKLLSIAIPLIVVATVINDTGQYLTARYHLSNVTQEAANAAADHASRNEDRNRAWQAGEDIARAQGATIYGYDQSDNRVHVWTQMTVRNTWMLHYASAYMGGEQPKGPLVIDDEAWTIIR